MFDPKLLCHGSLVGHVIEESSGNAAAFHIFSYAWRRRVRLVQPRCPPAWCWGQPTSINAHRWSPGAPLLGRDRFTRDLWWWAHGRNVPIHLSSLANLWVVSFSDSRFTRVIFEAVTLFMDLQGRVRGDEQKSQSQGFSFPSHLHQTSDKS